MRVPRIATDLFFTFQSVAVRNGGCYIYASSTSSTAKHTTVKLRYVFFSRVLLLELNDP